MCVHYTQTHTHTEGLPHAPPRGDREGPYKERVEREVGGGIGMGNTCKPMAVSFQCMTKFTTNKKKIERKKKDLLH